MVKTVVIVGLSASGTSVFQSLLKHIPASSSNGDDVRLVAINTQNFAYFPVGSLRASVVPGWENKIIAPLTGLVSPFKSESSSRHLVLGGSRVISVDFEAKSVTLDAPRSELDNEATLSYDYIVIATGSNYGIPCRPPSNIRTEDEAFAFLKKFQTEISTSQRILIVGSGPVGIEMAGEITSHYGKGKKEVTLVARGVSLFPETQWKEGLRKKLTHALEKAGVRILYSAKANLDGLQTGPLPTGTTVTVTHDDGREEALQADFLVMAIGNTPNTGIFPNHILSPSKRIITDDYLAVKGCTGAYALGDAMEGDIKTMAAIAPQASVVVNNLLVSIRGKGALKKHQDASLIMVVPVGTSSGAGQLFGMVIGGFLTGLIKGRSLFIGTFQGMYPRAPKA